MLNDKMKKKSQTKQKMLTRINFSNPLSRLLD
jgi:hypothetical protein